MGRLFYQRGSLIAGVSLLLAVITWCGYRVHRLSVDQKVIKQDYSIVNNISFGILSVNKWRDLMVDAVGHRIENFNLTTDEKDSVRREIEHILNALIDKADSMISAPQKSLKGKLQKFAFKTFVDTKSLHAQVPSFSSRIMMEVLRPRSKERLAYVAKSKLEDPVARRAYLGLYLLGRRSWHQNKLIWYFAFQSGKWSMADVMVVAIFMAYIGFNGILNDTMSDLNYRSDSWTSIATNNTSLQPGYLIFVTFVLFGLVLSQILKMITKSPINSAKNASIG